MAIHRQLHLSEVPLLFPLISLAAGIAIGIFATSVAGWLSVGSLLLLSGILAFFHLPRWAIGGMFIIVGLLLGKSAMPTTLTEPCTLQIKGLVTHVKDFGSSYRLVVRDRQERNLSLWLPDFDEELMQGDVVEFQGVALPPKYSGTVPDEITNRNFLITNGIYAEIAEVDSFRVIRYATGFNGWIAKVRNNLCNKLLHNGLTQRNEQFLKAVILGEVNIDIDTRNDFTRAGLSHILALSGTHVSVISFLIFILFAPLSLIGQKRTVKIAALTLLWGYALLTGMSPSVIRAVTMVSFVIVGNLINRNSQSINSLCAAEVVILLFSPLTLLSVGFQLSFLAVAGILLFMPLMLSPVLNLKNKIRRWVLPICTIIFLPVSAMLGTAPLSIYYFHILPGWFIIPNILIGFILPFVIAGGATLLIFGSIGLPVSLLATSLNWLIDLILSIANFFSSLQPESLNALYPSADVILLIYITILLFWLLWNNRRRVYLYGAGIAVITMLILIFAFPYQYPKVETYEWKAGNSYNLLYRYNSEAYIITDAPSKYHSSLLHSADFKLKDYLGKRRTTLVGVFADTLTLPNLSVHENLWRIGNDTYLILHDASVLQDSTWMSVAQSVDPKYIIISHGFKPDSTPSSTIPRISTSFPNSAIILSPALYAPYRSKLLESSKHLL